jgi:hypothetical protein
MSRSVTYPAHSQKQEQFNPHVQRAEHQTQFDPQEMMLVVAWRHASEEAVRAGQRLVRYRRKCAAKATHPAGGGE